MKLGKLSNDKLDSLILSKFGHMRKAGLYAMGKQPVHLGGYGRIRKELNNAPRHYFTYIRHFCKLFHSGASQRLYCAEATRQILCRLRADVGYAYGKYESAQSAVLAALDGGHKVVYSALAKALQSHVVLRPEIV